MPGQTIPSNVPAAALRWSLLRAAKELGFISAPTLATRLKGAGQQPDQGGCWSSAQVLAAAYGGDLHAQRIRETAERADALNLRNRAFRGELVSRDEVMDLLTQAGLAIRRVIETSPLGKIEQDEILKTLAATPVRLRAIGAAQSRNGNGAGAAEPAKRKRGRPPKSAEAKAAVSADG